MTTVLVVDDEQAVRESIAAILTAEPGIEVVGTAADAARAVCLVSQLQPDVVLMDLRMPNVDGVTLTRQLLAQPGDRPAVLALTTFATDDMALAAIGAGAAGFCDKAQPSAELAHAVRTVAAGGAIVCPWVLRALLSRLGAPEQESRMRPDCSARELEVLALVAQGAPNAEIAERLYISDATVRTHLTHLRRKFEARSRAELVVRAWEFGLNTR